MHQVGKEFYFVIHCDSFTLWGIVVKSKPTSRVEEAQQSLILKELFMRDLRWYDTVFQGQYLPSLSINYMYVTINKDLEKLPPKSY